LTPDVLRNKLNVTKRESNSRIGVLMNYDLVDMIDNQYTLTTLGNDAYDSLRMIDNAIRMKEKFNTNDNNILDDISFLY
jgi:predicted transcriptional regulator